MKVIHSPPINSVLSIAWGIDYLRFRIETDIDVEYIQRRLPYVDITARWFHGFRFVDLTGKQLELVRMVESLELVVMDLCYLFPVTRIDVFVDALGKRLDDITAIGTQIYNGGKLETVYSANLKSRGNVAIFGRAYDARAAGHYDVEVTRFEIEFKQNACSGLIGPDGWKKDVVGVAVHVIGSFFGVRLDVGGSPPIEYNPPTRKLSHGREKFYAKYGKSILTDIEDMGVGGLQEFIKNCVKCKGVKE